MTGFYPEGIRLDSADNLRAMRSSRALYEAMNSGEILESVAYMCDSDHNLSVRLGSMKGVIPREEGAMGIREGSVRDIAILSRVGYPVSFVVKDIVTENGQPVAVLSRAEAQRRCAEEYLSALKSGDIIPARITHLEPFGAFCDIGCGVVALMPIDTISISRIEHPDERFRVGMDIYAVIKSRVGTRITLSHKELLGTWEQNIGDYRIGETVTGVIRSIENYGAFVELTPNLAGLAELRDGLRVGSQASVYIKNIIPSRMKVKLIIIDILNTAPDVAAPRYFITSGHIDRFIYSPPGCDKYVATEYNDDT